MAPFEVADAGPPTRGDGGGAVAVGKDLDGDLGDWIGQWRSGDYLESRGGSSMDLDIDDTLTSSGSGAVGVRRTDAHLAAAASLLVLAETEAPRLRLSADRERDREMPLPAESARAKRRMEGREEGPGRVCRGCVEVKV